MTMEALTSVEALAKLCNGAHYFQAHMTQTGFKVWVCCRCMYAKPFGGDRRKVDR